MLRPCRARNDKYRYGRNDKRRHCAGHIPICHCEEGASPTNQSFLTCQEIASPLQGSPLQDSQARNDKLRPCCARMTICHCEEGASPTWQSFLACHSNRWNHLPGWDVIKISFRHDKNGNPSAALTPGSAVSSCFYGLPVLWYD